MRRVVVAAAAAVLALAAVPAVADQCIDETALWSVPYPQGEIQTISYYVWQQSPHPPPTLFRVIYRTGEVHIHQAVPTAVAQRFTGLTSADTTYAQTVKRRYSQLLLAEVTNCPLLNETGKVYLLGEFP